MSAPPATRRCGRVAARATCIDGLLTGRGANEALRVNPVGNPSVHIELSGHLWWWGRHRFHTQFTQGQRFFWVAAELGRACFKLERLGHKLATLSKGNPSIFFVQVQL